MLVAVENLARPETTLALARGTARLLADMGFAALAELPLGNGRRADLIGLNRQNRIVIVEVKSSLEDFRADQKWPEYLEYCDRFFFAVTPDFPREILPENTGLIVADRFGGMVLRAAPEQKPVPPSRRRSVTLQFALQSAGRLRRLLDPEL